MKKILLRVILVLVLVLGFGANTPALARHVFGTGTTQAGITFVANPNSQKGDDGDAVNTGKAGALVDEKIPSGKKVTVTKNPVTSPGVLVKSAAADIIAGRLPQTNETQALLVTLLGLMLLIVMILLGLVYHQARLLKERE